MSLLAAAHLITHSLRVDEPTFNFPAGIDWPQLVHHADGHSLTPLLYDTWHKAGVLHKIPADICDRMSQAYSDNARRNINIRVEVREIDQILTKAGTPHLLLKGWGLIEWLYDDPAHRVLYDHDFLVSPDRAEAGWQALVAAGFHPFPVRDGWVEKHLQPVWRNNGYQWDGYLFDPHYPRPVELHTTLWDNGWRGLRINTLPNLWRDTQTQSVAGRPMQLLSPENTLLHLAMHFAGHLIEREARLNQLLDLARFQAKHHSGLNWDLVSAGAGEANIGRFVYASLYLAHTIFGAPLPPVSVWQQLMSATPPNFINWLAARGSTDILTSDYRRVAKGKDYQLTFLVANSWAERAGIVRFAAVPPVEQLMATYNFKQRWLGPVYYVRHIFERLTVYGQGVTKN